MAHTNLLHFSVNNGCQSPCSALCLRVREQWKNNKWMENLSAAPWCSKWTQIGRLGDRNVTESAAGGCLHSSQTFAIKKSINTQNGICVCIEILQLGSQTLDLLHVMQHILRQTPFIVCMTIFSDGLRNCQQHTHPQTWSRPCHYFILPNSSCRID